VSGAPSNRAPATVLYTAWAPFFSGAERALVILLENLDRSRYRPVVALGTTGELERELTTRGIATVHMPVIYAGIRTAVPWARTVLGLARLCRREDVALVHANDVPSFQPVGYAARLLRLPAITHVRFPDSRSGFGWFLRPGFDQALFVSGALRDAAIEEAPDLFQSRSIVVHDGVRMPDEPDGNEITRLRAELGLPVDGIVVAITGQVSEIKGIWEFIDAVSLLARRGSPATFAVLGDDLKGHGALRIEAERVVAEKGLASRVRFLGFRADAPRLIPAFDIIAVPSHVEPLGNATLEAMAAGRPVVGSRVGGIPEMVVEGETGLLVPPRDAPGLANALESLIGDPARARALGRAARVRAADAFSPRAHADQVQGEYDQARRARESRRT
jgi:glycosyltransferase involved in cell wall biosynthesis